MPVFINPENYLLCMFIWEKQITEQLQCDPT